MPSTQAEVDAAVAMFKASAQTLVSGGTAASASGTYCPPATQLTDSSGGVWTLPGGSKTNPVKILLNGSNPAAALGIATRIAFCQGKIKAVRDDMQAAWEWTGSGWNQISLIQLCPQTN